MSFTMPDVRNLSQADAQAAILAASGDATIQVDLWPSATPSYSDIDFLGGNVGTGVTATTVGGDGTIATQNILPGTTVTIAGDHTLSFTHPDFGSESGFHLSFDIWGVSVDTDPAVPSLIVTVGDWASDDAHTLAPTASLTTGPWIWADWEAGSSFRIELWTLHKPTGTGTLIGEVTQFSDISVKESLNDQTELKFTMSMEDSLLADWAVDAHTQAAKVYYRNQIKPVYFAPVTYSEDYSTAEGKLTISGVNAIRTQYQFLRRGDVAINEPDDHGSITLDGDGYNLLLNAAENTAEQDVRDVPSLGITLDDRGTLDDDLVVGVDRGDNVWDTAKSVAANALGRDFELDPQADVDDLYMLFRVWNKRGSDRTATVRFYYGVTDPTDNPDAVDNVSALTATPLQRITHCHVLDAEKRYRVTAASAAASEAAGVFVAWVQSDLTVQKRPSTKKPDLRALEALAKATIDAYSSAPRSVDLTLRPDAGQTAFYREQFWPGDTVWIAAARGYRSFSGNYRIRDVEIGEQGSRGLSVTKISVVPDIAADELDEDS